MKGKLNIAKITWGFSYTYLHKKNDDTMLTEARSREKASRQSVSSYIEFFHELEELNRKKPHLLNNAIQICMLVLQIYTISLEILKK